MRNDDHWDWENAYARDDEREPTRRRERRSRHELNRHGSVRVGHEQSPTTAAALEILRKAGAL